MRCLDIVGCDGPEQRRWSTGGLGPAMKPRLFPASTHDLSVLDYYPFFFLGSLFFSTPIFLFVFVGRATKDGRVTWLTSVGDALIWRGVVWCFRLWSATYHTTPHTTRSRRERFSGVVM